MPQSVVCDRDVVVAVVITAIAGCGGGVHNLVRD